MPDTDTPEGAVPHAQGAFRRAIVPVTLGVGSLAAFIWMAWAIFDSQREDVAIARAFLTHIATEQNTQAIALMAPILVDDIGGPGELQSRFGEIEPWDHIGFSSRNTTGFGDMRTTELFGVGEAVSGCESVLHIQMVNGLIHAFNISPLCPQVGTDA